MHTAGIHTLYLIGCTPDLTQARLPDSTIGSSGLLLFLLVKCDAKVDFYLPEQKGSFHSRTLPRINGFYICLCHRLPQKVLHGPVFFQRYVELLSTCKE